VQLLNLVFGVSFCLVCGHSIPPIERRCKYGNGYCGCFGFVLKHVDYTPRHEQAVTSPQGERLVANGHDPVSSIHKDSQVVICMDMGLFLGSHLHNVMTYLGCDSKIDYTDILICGQRILAQSIFDRHSRLAGGAAPVVD